MRKSPAVNFPEILQDFVLFELITFCHKVYSETVTVSKVNGGKGVSIVNS
jgi:hypothetical protein